ncbi:MAG: S-methyl-5-thioribose-1-phosphate isomerase [Thermoproteus sp. AZ2]|jgi:translation initiation factor eIF-2B subunit alpha|uniref:S-methyl-5-thioribose-1-phosphate isomerase n=1 Tax=Thermoproteus sp. AZ2 TaxID=1609232 RepID=A0ACC6UZZ6_9CREN|nr:MAG: translation initiation factor IF-2B subunit alpha [Thermoproteus sp. AZ2]
MERLVAEIKASYRPKLKVIEWRGDRLSLLDQRLLPFEVRYLELKTVDGVADAIRNMAVRGAPAIGITAAYGMALAVKERPLEGLEQALEALRIAKEKLAKTRPTAQNLFWALDRMYKRAEAAVQNGEAKNVKDLADILGSEANKVFDEEFESEIRMGLYGVQLLQPGDVVLTQCNAGSLATGALGTATAPIYVAKHLGIDVSVIAPETRPWQQGARLTAFELRENGVKVKVIADTAVGLVISRRMVNLAIVGADRILADGTVFNKIGTLNEAVLAHEFGVPFYVAAPASTFDLVHRPEEVKIEERNPDEVRTVRTVNGNVYITMRDIDVYNPVFDATPPKYITAIITEKGIITQPLDRNIRRLLSGPQNT